MSVTAWLANANWRPIAAMAEELANNFQSMSRGKRNLVVFGAIIIWMDYPLAPYYLVRFAVWTIPKTILWTIPKTIVLNCFGFTPKGPRRDSYASEYQSDHYGGDTPEDSMFSWAQSEGARSGPLSDLFYCCTPVLLVYGGVRLLKWFVARRK